ncbi:TMAO reductase system periplasmic protein TorT [Pseudodesulfovibrio sediminis]|uniref:TMAO reductase system periplasmic protein TorT n=1 Tax=Pseudodesulfovibrio sediminis TaxID=2810563 RepID=A0ABM7P6K1_9BACT|nr:TMAO reductase system periplasmic protein TorT [Pseudodesulfovibrio sediminis]BCS89158.1 TMAO reductase system periplasmic protein TorT [Pseudodesulfovibrio sediminis]
MKSISYDAYSLRWSLAVVLFLFLSLIPTPAEAQETAWWPLQVKSYYGRYDTRQKQAGHASASLNSPKLEEWVPPPPPDTPITLGVCLPHMKDAYWVALNFGIIDEARRLGVGIRLVEAGGYDNLQTQISQMRQLERDGVDAIILSAISYTDNNQSIARTVARSIPVIEVVNDVLAPAVTAKAMVSFYEMGYFAGEFVAEQAETAGLQSVSIAFFPGPAGSGWAPESLIGFKEAMRHFPGPVEIRDVVWGDTGHDTQRKLIEWSQEKTGPVDYIVGNAVAAAEAPAALARLGRQGTTQVVSTYITPTLYDSLSRGDVAASPSDLTIFQGRMAVDMCVRVLRGEIPGKDFPFRSGPFSPMITPDNIASYPYEGLFGPRGYVPIFNLDPAH